MADYVDQFTEAEAKKLSSKIERVYKQAAKDIKAKIKTFNAEHKAKDEQMQALVASGDLSEADYKKWLQSQVFQGKQWKQKLDDITKVYVDADEKAREILGGTEKNVFAEAANYTAYEIDLNAKAGVAFNLYDKNTVENLLKNNPQMLPKYKTKEDKDYTWNAMRVRNEVAQGIIQGESVSEIGERLTTQLAASNAKKMEMFARTAITGAQNAGRMERMHEAQDMGISVKKKWLATLDSRTRDAHAELDGQEQDVDDPFVLQDGRKIDYPGDPTAPPELVYNCRCTLVYVYPKYGSKGLRMDQESGETIAEGISYQEWKLTKDAGRLDELDTDKRELANLTYEAVANDAFHVFKGIWKDDVTYADYWDKVGSIPAKRDYYINEIDRQTRYGNTAKVQELQEKLAELDKFESMGAANNMMLDLIDVQKENIAKIMKDVTPAPPSPFTDAAYTPGRKANALRAATGEEADKALRDKSGEVWRAATDEEKDAAYEYTQSYHKFNEPLRGIEYGTNRYLGVGNTDLDASYAHNGERLNNLTSIIDKSSYDKDIYLVRGCFYDGMDKFFGVDMDLLQYGSQADLEAALLGKSVTEYAFMSCGSAAGKGFQGRPIMLNIYAPSGTKMLYVEPFSAYGASGEGMSWDGKSKQWSFGQEQETLLQQGTQFRITGVKRHGRGGTIEVDVEVIDQSNKQLWHK